MPIDILGDFQQILAANDLGTAVTALIDGVEVIGFFVEGYSPVNLQGLTVAGMPLRFIAPSARLADVSSGQPGEGSSVVIAGVYFEIVSLQPQGGLGLTTIELREA